MKEKKIKKIGILGCGWLGLPLAKELVQNGYFVHGSTTSSQKKEVIKAVGATPFLVHCKEDSHSGLEAFTNGLDTVIITLPPGLRSNPLRRHDLVIYKIVQHLLTTKIEHLIFISSTSVYGQQSGTLTEDSPLVPTTESGVQLVACESLLKKTKAFHSTIIRFGGLIGPKRHPIFTLTKKPYLENPNEEINLIHLDECITILLKSIERNKQTVVYNGVNPSHFSREFYYNKIAEIAKLRCPPFILKKEYSRIISSKKVQKELAIDFSVENLLTLN